MKWYTGIVIIGALFNNNDTHFVVLNGRYYTVMKWYTGIVIIGALFNNNDTHFFVLIGRYYTPSWNDTRI